MRIAPHGVMAGNSGEAAKNAWCEAALTHPSWEARASSALVATLVAHLIGGAPLGEALEASFAPVSQ